MIAFIHRSFRVDRSDRCSQLAVWGCFFFDFLHAGKILRISNKKYKQRFTIALWTMEFDRMSPWLITGGNFFFFLNKSWPNSEFLWQMHSGRVSVSTDFLFDIVLLAESLLLFEDLLLWIKSAHLQMQHQVDSEVAREDLSGKFIFSVFGRKIIETF